MGPQTLPSLPPATVIIERPRHAGLLVLTPLRGSFVSRPAIKDLEHLTRLAVGPALRQQTLPGLRRRQVGSGPQPLMRIDSDRDRAIGNR